MPKFWYNIFVNKLNFVNLVKNTLAHWLYQWACEIDFINLKSFDVSKNLYKKGIIKEDTFNELKDKYNFNKEHDDKEKDVFEIEMWFILESMWYN